MQSRLLIGLFVAGALCACAKSEALDESEQKYVNLSLALIRARAPQTDSLGVRRALDSVYRTFKSDSATFHASTLAFDKSPDRSSLVFRAISDSLRAH